MRPTCAGFLSPSSGIVGSSTGAGSATLQATAQARALEFCPQGAGVCFAFSCPIGAGASPIRYHMAAPPVVRSLCKRTRTDGGAVDASGAPSSFSIHRHTEDLCRCFASALRLQHPTAPKSHRPLSIQLPARVEAAGARLRVCSTRSEFSADNFICF